MRCLYLHSHRQPQQQDHVRWGQSGFTLIELLVSLTIFAVLAAAGWQVFSQLQQTRERVDKQAEKLSQLQQAYMQLQRDITQIVNRPVMENGEQVAALTLSRQSLSFTKSASIDPRYLVQSPLERVRYEVKDNTLIRYNVKQLDNDNETPLPMTVLTDVERVKFSALDPGESHLWPSLDAFSAQASSTVSAAQPNVANVPDTTAAQGTQNPALTQLPVGVSVALTYAGNQLVWRFALPKAAPRVAPPTQQKASQSKSSQGKSSQQTLSQADDEEDRD